MVAVAFVLGGLAFGMLASISVFLKPLSAELGWGRGETAFGYTAIAMSSAVFGVLWGYVADRIGSRWFGLVAAVVMTTSLFLLSGQETLVEFYGYYFLYGAFGTALVSAPLFANVGFWFKRNAGLALGITAAGGAFGQALVPYVAGQLIEIDGWQQAYRTLAWGYLVVALPIAFLVRESPQRELARSGQGERSTFVLSEWEVVAWISAAVIFCCICMSVPIVHLVPLLTDNGATMESATTVLMVLMLSGVAGRIMGGKLADIIGALPAYMAMSLGQTIFVVWFPYVSGTVGLYTLAVFFGFTYSGVMSSILVCTREMVSAGFAGRAMAMTSFFGWVGMGSGAFFGGFFYDLQGNYFFSYGFAAAMGTVNLAILAAFYFRIVRRGPRGPVEVTV